MFSFSRALQAAWTQTFTQIRRQSFLEIRVRLTAHPVTDRQTDRQTETDRETETNRQPDRQTDRQTDRQR